MVVRDHAEYAKQSPVTEPGDLAGRLDEVPGDLASLQGASSRLVFHYRGDGDFAENGIVPERIHEIDTRYADAMFGRLFELHDVPLTEDRAPNQRLVGCCRDFTVLFLAMARGRGIPARARVGFAAYFVAGWSVDHMIAEVWDAAERRWRLVDPELRPGHVDPNDGAILDPLDLTPDRFIVAPQAWLKCRAGRADPDRFVVDPELEIPVLRGWPQLAHNLVHDLAALNKQEMVLWDAWGLAEQERHSAEQLELLDRVAERLMDPDVSVDALRQLYARDELRVPPIVNSYSPAAETPLRVSLVPRDSS